MIIRRKKQAFLKVKNTYIVRQRLIKVR